MWDKVDLVVILESINPRERVGDYRKLDDSEFWRSISYDC